MLYKEELKVVTSLRKKNSFSKNTIWDIKNNRPSSISQLFSFVRNECIECEIEKKMNAKETKV